MIEEDGRHVDSSRIVAIEDKNRVLLSDRKAGPTLSSDALQPLKSGEFSLVSSAALEESNQDDTVQSKKEEMRLHGRRRSSTVAGSPKNEKGGEKRHGWMRGLRRKSVQKEQGHMAPTSHKIAPSPQRTRKVHPIEETPRTYRLQDQGELYVEEDRDVRRSQTQEIVRDDPGRSLDINVVNLIEGENRDAFKEVDIRNRKNESGRKRGSVPLRRRRRRSSVTEGAELPEKQTSLSTRETSLRKKDSGKKDVDSWSRKFRSSSRNLASVKIPNVPVERHEKRKRTAEWVVRASSSQDLPALEEESKHKPQRRGRRRSSTRLRAELTRTGEEEARDSERRPKRTRSGRLPRAATETRAHDAAGMRNNLSHRHSLPGAPTRFQDAQAEETLHRTEELSRDGAFSEAARLAANQGSNYRVDAYPTEIDENNGSSKKRFLSRGQSFINRIENIGSRKARQSVEEVKEKFLPGFLKGNGGGRVPRRENVMNDQMKTGVFARVGRLVGRYS